MAGGARIGRKPVSVVIAEIGDDGSLAARGVDDGYVHSGRVTRYLQDLDTIDEIDVAVDDAEPFRPPATQEADQRLLEKIETLGRHRIGSVVKLVALNDQAGFRKEIQIAAMIVVKMRHDDHVDLCRRDLHRRPRLAAQ